MKRTVTALAAGALLFAACGDDSTDSAATEPAGPATTAAPVTSEGSARECAAEATLAPGALTIATGDPAFPPYVIDDAPESGKGFEAAVALAVAKEMGFDGAAVTWIRTGFDAAIAPGAKDFDFNLQQFSINPERAEIVTFSKPYYTANQAVLGYIDGPAAAVASIADLATLKLGAAAGTTSLQFIIDVIQPEAEPFAFNSNADAKAALDNKQIDAIITDVPTGLYISAVEIEGTKVFGQFPVGAGGAGDSWGLLFAKDNPLAACADLALAALTSSGELAAIEATWMSDYTEAPELAAG